VHSADLPIGTLLASLASRSHLPAASVPASSARTTSCTSARSPSASILNVVGP